jgi:hypothetical protein
VPGTQPYRFSALGRRTPRSGSSVQLSSLGREAAPRFASLHRSIIMNIVRFMVFFALGLLLPLLLLVIMRLLGWS